MLRSQSQAEYAADNYGHFGLNLRRYAHFTSPIRRYADLIVHRALIPALKLGEDGLPPDTTRAELVEISATISAAERRAMAAERETIDRLIAHFLADQIGAIFEGRISGVTKSGLFVKLANRRGWLCSGGDHRRRLLPLRRKTHSLRASDGRNLSPGRQVQVKLVEAHRSRERCASSSSPRAASPADGAPARKEPSTRRAGRAGKAFPPERSGSRHAREGQAAQGAPDV